MQNGLAEAPQNKSRKQIKERKNRTKKIRGVKKNSGYPLTQHHVWMLLCLRDFAVDCVLT